MQTERCTTCDPKKLGRPCQPWHGIKPKKMTKGIRRQLRRTYRENPLEFERQAAIVGVTKQEVGVDA